MGASLTVGGYQFVCIPLAETDFSDVAAIYVILCVTQDGNWTVLDVGQSDRVGSRIDWHDRKGCWKRNCPGENIRVCVHRMSASTKQEREHVESMLRNLLKPSCGER